MAFLALNFSSPIYLISGLISRIIERPRLNELLPCKSIVLSRSVLQNTNSHCMQVAYQINH